MHIRLIDEDGTFIDQIVEAKSLQRYMSQISDKKWVVFVQQCGDIAINMSRIVAIKEINHDVIEDIWTDNSEYDEIRVNPLQDKMDMDAQIEELRAKLNEFEVKERAKRDAYTNVRIGEGQEQQPLALIQKSYEHRC